MDWRTHSRQRRRCENPAWREMRFLDRVGRELLPTCGHCYHRRSRGSRSASRPVSAVAASNGNENGGSRRSRGDQPQETGCWNKKLSISRRLSEMAFVIKKLSGRHEKREIRTGKPRREALSATIDSPVLVVLAGTSSATIWATRFSP